jgi:hypothetical protein
MSTNQTVAQAQDAPPIPSTAPNFDDFKEQASNTLGADFIPPQRQSYNDDNGGIAMQDRTFMAFKEQASDKLGTEYVPPPRQVYGNESDVFKWPDGQGMDSDDHVLHNRAPIASNTRVDFANALVRLTAVEEDTKVKITAFKGRVNLKLDMRYHPLGLEEFNNPAADVWAYPKEGYFAGIPEGALISSNMEYVPQATQMAALLAAVQGQQEQEAWLDNLYRTGAMTDSAADGTQGTAPLLTSVISPFSSTLADTEDGVARMDMYNLFDDQQQDYVAMHLA